MEGPFSFPPGHVTPPVVQAWARRTKESIVSRTSQNSIVAKSSSVVLAPLADPKLAPPASRIEDRQLKPEPFKPEAGQPDEADGFGLSRFGARFRTVFAGAHNVDEADVDLGLVRHVEALNANTERNLAALSASQYKRTEHGSLEYVRLTVNTPLLMPWLLNGRALRRMGAALRGATKIVTAAADHKTYSLPTMAVAGPDTVLEIVAAQRRLLGLENYSASGKKKEKRARVDSIVQYGVLEQPDVVLVQLQSEGGNAWVAQAAEGAQRLFSALLAMDQLANRSVTTVATDHWFAADRLGDFTADDLIRLANDLKYGTTAAAGYFPARDVKAWLENTAETNAAAVAFQLLRTMEINLVIAVHPDPAVTADEPHPVASTVQEMIRSYHVPGKAKDQWALADVQGLIAIGAIDELVEGGRVSADSRSYWLGEQLAEWSQPGEEDAIGRLGNTARLIATLTTQGGAPGTSVSQDDSIHIVNRHLRLNGMRVHADDRARVAASQAVIALGEQDSGRENGLAAALHGTFNSPWFWKTIEHSGGPWTSLLDTPLTELVAKARAEAKAAAGNIEKSGPAQRALAALGGIALMANPGLLENDKALSKTGRGGGGKATDVKASDPHAVLTKMVQDDRGIDQLRDAIAVLTLNDQTSIPIDQVDDEPLEDFYLRRMWLGETTDHSNNPHTEFARRIQILAEAIFENAAEADRLRTQTESEIIGDERGEVENEALYDLIGVNEETADKVVPLVQELNEFFTTGKALARAAARAAR